VLGARSVDRLEALAEELGGPERALARRCDVTEWEDQEAFFDNPVSGALEPEDIARAVMYAVSQPPRVDVNEILIRPVSQES
jgi:NADP-dependent 3-hydroxy acid dehydrogenase YdfG